MDINEARELAHEIMAEYIVGWSFEFDQAKRRFGLCSYRRKTIFLSAPLTKINDRRIIEDTIRHEVAHVIAGPGSKHGPEWKEACYVTGANPKSCVEGDDVVRMQAPWRQECPNCGVSQPRHRRTKRAFACAACCRRYNGGKFTEEFLLVFVPNDDIASN